MKNPAVSFAIVLVAAALAGSVPAAASEKGIYFSVSNLSQLSLDEVVADLGDARVIIIGEQHGNFEHHRVQLAMLRALEAKGKKVAVGLEMFRGDAQAELDLWIAGRLSLDELFAIYVDHWAPDYWWSYAEIFTFAREKLMPLIALNIPRAVVRQVARQGYDGISSELRQNIPEVDCSVSSTYLTFLQDLTGIKEQSQGSFVSFCEAQVLWDAVMAERVVTFAKKHPDRVIVVLAGSFHAWKHGIAAQIERISDLPVKVVLPSGDKSVLKYDIFLKDADYVWWENAEEEKP